MCLIFSKINCGLTRRCRWEDSVRNVNIEATPTGANVVLKVSGRMDATNSQEFEVACTPWIDQGVKHIIVDLTALEYVSSMGLRYFVNVGKRLNDGGGTLRLCGVNGIVKQLFQITRLTNVFPMHDTVEAALASV
ncbi:MAG: STAS domain-containing protein [Acidobacteria bacterium]|nr:STAS domain-containing protein [Acidobacteriota bacterium]